MPVMSRTPYFDAVPLARTGQIAMAVIARFVEQRFSIAIRHTGHGRLSGARNKTAGSREDQATAALQCKHILFDLGPGKPAGYRAYSSHLPIY